MNGSVYIATNEYLPDLVKIGRSADPARRMLELSGSAGVPGTFKLAHAVRVADMYDVEARMHRRFAARRVKGSEFFRMTVGEAKVGLARVAFRSRFLPPVTRRPSRGVRAGRPASAPLLLALAACGGAAYATAAGAGLTGFAALLAFFGVFLVLAARYNRHAPKRPARRKGGIRLLPAGRPKRWTRREMIALALGVTIALGLFVRLNGAA